MEAHRIEHELLELPVAERARIIVNAWDSLFEQDTSDPNFDAEGIEVAQRRDNGIERGATKPIPEDEFRERTNRRG